MLAEELIEAQAMSGTGPWQATGTTSVQRAQLVAREASPLISQGAGADIELALQNVEWSRQVSLSWLEFSRWGIQQIILISRLYYIKNPMIRRGIDVGAAYVFGAGFEISSDDEAADDVLDEFFERNKMVLGQNALVEQEKAKDYDGNLFWCLFADKVDKGKVSIRTIDATEIQEIVCDPDDSDTPQLYRRLWTQRNFSMETGESATETYEQWYPALGWSPDQKPEKIAGKIVNWTSPVLHRKCGQVSKWHFGCPRVYPAIEGARMVSDFLQACFDVQKSLAQIAVKITSKGGQTALEGIKQQLQTNVSAQGGNSLWDTNPTANNASLFASGPGTTVEAFKTRGMSGNPEEVRQFKLAVAMVLGIPETFFGDVSTGNLATATTLDRPTELGFICRQESWREDLLTICRYVLSVSSGAPSGALREAYGKESDKLSIREAQRVRKPSGRFEYRESPKTDGVIELKCTFPAIRDADVPGLIKAVVEAMTLNNRQGQIVGIDERAGVALLFDLVEQIGEIGDKEAMLDAMFPDGEYDPDRTVEDLPPPVAPNPGGEPQLPGGNPPIPEPKTEAYREAMRLIESVRKFRRDAEHVGA